MNNISTEIFSACCEISMAEDVLSMCIERMESSDPEMGGMHAVALLLEKARKRLEAADTEAGKPSNAI